MIINFAAALNDSVKGGDLMVYKTVKLHDVSFTIHPGPIDFDEYLSCSGSKLVMRKKSLTLAFISVLLCALGATWLYVKQGAASAAVMYSTTWNDSKKCYINSYIPQYSRFGVVGKFVKLFTSEAFFRVYTDKGELLKSSEWLLWQSEFTTDERSQWVHGHAIYPTSTGYEGWNISECASLNDSKENALNGGFTARVAWSDSARRGPGSARSDARVLQDNFSMSSTTRQVTRVL
ncbi:hypothetical protein [Pseudomonas viridiflava]|uniref:hypothetical protein n=1 Tax=Pseudomonas viridiflava TaxID=33069 RepID=UPI001F11EB91|nr:hypothetical protein [Pseudomonas viridiflava]